MNRFTRVSCFLATVSVGALLPLSVRAQEALPPDVHADTRNRLPPFKSSNPSAAPDGVAAILLHGSGVQVRWSSPLGRALTELAILTSAREHDQPFEWSLHEMEALAVGLDPAVIDIVRNRKPLAGVGDKASVIIETGREIFGTHKLRSETYARALKVLGESNLVDIVDLMGDYAGTAARLTAINQQMPAGWKQFLPLPFTLPDDVYPDSRSRLPLWFQNQTQSAAPPRPQTSASVPRPQNAPPPPALYSRSIAPEGTGPGQIGRHGAGLQSLEASVGRRLLALAILVTAREHDAQYDWTMNEPAAIKDGLEPAIIDQVRHRKPVTGLGDKEATLIEFGRELFGKHVVSAQTYARALKMFGERDLVDFTNLMGRHASDATVLTAFDQHLPAGQKPLLPIP